MAFTSAAVAVVGLGYAIYSGEQQRRAAKKGLQQQQAAQNQAQAAAISQARQAEEEEQRARRKSPNLAVLLGEQQKGAPGSKGVDSERLLLGKPGLLGY